MVDDLKTMTNIISDSDGTQVSSAEKIIRHVHIRITAQQTGTGILRNEPFVAGKAIDLYKVKEVPTYKLIVNDDLTNIETIYQITRHAVFDDKRYNRYFHYEPENELKRYRGGYDENKLGAGRALFLFEDNDDKIRGEFVGRGISGGNNAFLQIHVGGIYINKKHGKIIATSSGCFTLNGPDSGDAGRDRFNNDIGNRHDRLDKKSKIYIIFEKLRR